MVKECVGKANLDLAVFQETEKGSISHRLLRSCCSHKLSELLTMLAMGSAGGILVVWDPNIISEVDEKS